MSANDTSSTELSAVDTEPASHSHATSASTDATTRRTAEYASMRHVMSRFA
jgi:hypothetical protein